jgi:hypothetical protein
MKKYLLLICFCIIILKSQAQIVFCPPGAEWHYSFTRGFPSQNIFYNEKIYYKNDTVINSQTFKVLKHSMALWSDCFDNNTTSLTLIKQNGDTVFFRNALTKHQWQILYNFAALAGQSWTNTLTSGSSSLSYTILVDGVGTIQSNGTNLKQLAVKYNGVPSMIHERLGSNQFLFNFYYSNCDGYYFRQRLCYKDNAFSQIQFTNLSCDYNTLSLNENEKNNYDLNLFPNPGKDFLNISFTSAKNTSNYKIKILDMIGKVQLIDELHHSNQKTHLLNIYALEKGIYFLQFWEEEKLVLVEKIVKD